MPICPWCEKETLAKNMIEHPLPDDDSIEVCIKCSLQEEDKKESRFVTPRLKTQERTYVRV